MSAIVTKNSLRTMLDNASYVKRIAIVGRALVALHRRQTASEQETLTTRFRNKIGFTASDASPGSRAALYYLTNGTLPPHHLDRWLAISRRTGYPTICSYASQLNDVAEGKAALQRTAQTVTITTSQGVLL